MTASVDTLILAWGNPGRRDDGLGPACGACVARQALPSVEVITDYQLQIEHAPDLARARRVIFVDAARRGPAPFSYERLGSVGQSLGFTSHGLTARQLMALARDLFDAQPHAHLLAIRGYLFDDFGEVLSPRAAENLAAAVAFVTKICRAGESRDAGSLSAGTVRSSPRPSAEGGAL